MNFSSKKFDRFLGLFLLFSSGLVFAQYTQSDSALVRTTFLREFNKKIISNYLHSDNSNKVRAALLSISHSEDSTFIDSVISLNVNKYADYIAFALGQLGESEKSAKYLLENYQKPSGETFLLSIGKCGDSLTLASMLNYSDSSGFDKNSEITSALFPMVITDFYARGITNKNALKYLVENLTRKILADSISTDNSFSDALGKSILDEVRIQSTVYALYRLGSTKETIPELVKILKGDFSNQIKLYALGNFRKLKYFPNDIDLLKKLLSDDSWLIRTETANSVCFYRFKTGEEIDLYIELLFDENPNVSRTAAIGIKNLRNVNSPYLKTKIEDIIVKNEIPINTRGELFLSYASLFGVSSENMIDNYSDFVDMKFVYRLMAVEKSDYKFNYKFLKNRIEKSSEVELLDLLPAYLALQNKYFNDTEYASYLLKILESEKASSASIIAEGLGIPFIMKHKDALQELLLKQVFKNMNNPQFAESIVAFSKLAYKLGRPFYDSIIEMLSKSELYSVKRFAFNKMGKQIKVKKDSKVFNFLWEDVFKYKYADVSTNKGTFTVELHPEYAPVTCANFVHLSKEGFYNDVKFHRVVPDFVIQTGDTTGTGWGGPGYEIVSEFSPKPFNRAAVGIASIGKDTEGSQWFVMHSNFPHLNGRYTNWAEVISGMEIVDIINEGDKIFSIKLK